MNTQEACLLKELCRKYQTWLRTNTLAYLTRESVAKIVKKFWNILRQVTNPFTEKIENSSSTAAEPRINYSYDVDYSDAYGDGSQRPNRHTVTSKGSGVTVPYYFIDIRDKLVSILSNFFVVIEAAYKQSVAKHFQPSLIFASQTMNQPSWVRCCLSLKSLVKLKMFANKNTLAYLSIALKVKKSSMTLTQCYKTFVFVNALNK